MKKKISVVILMAIVCVLVGVVCIFQKENKVDPIAVADTTEVQKTEPTESNPAETVEIGFEFEDEPETSVDEGRSNVLEGNAASTPVKETIAIGEINSDKEKDEEVSEGDGAEVYYEKDPNSLRDDEF